MEGMRWGPMEGMRWGPMEGMRARAAAWAQGVKLRGGSHGVGGLGSHGAWAQYIEAKSSQVQYIEDAGGCEGGVPWRVCVGVPWRAQYIEDAGGDGEGIEREPSRQVVAHNGTVRRDPFVVDVEALPEDGKSVSQYVSK
jgi:hypothetical protein